MIMMMVSKNMTMTYGDIWPLDLITCMLCHFFGSQKYKIELSQIVFAILFLVMQEKHYYERKDAMFSVGVTNIFSVLQLQMQSLGSDHLISRGGKGFYLYYLLSIFLRSAKNQIIFSRTSRNHLIFLLHLVHISMGQIVDNLFVLLKINNIILFSLQINFFSK